MHKKPTKTQKKEDEAFEHDLLPRLFIEFRKQGHSSLEVDLGENEKANKQAKWALHNRFFFFSMGILHRIEGKPVSNQENHTDDWPTTGALLSSFFGGTLAQ